jgi:hypothetical protein
MALRKLIKIGLLSDEPKILLKAKSVLGLMNLMVIFRSPSAATTQSIWQEQSKHLTICLPVWGWPFFTIFRRTGDNS